MQYGHHLGLNCYDPLLLVDRVGWGLHWFELCKLQTNHGPTFMHLGLVWCQESVRWGEGWGSRMVLCQSLFHIVSRPSLAHSHARTNRVDWLCDLFPMSFSSLCAAWCWDLAGVLNEEAWLGRGLSVSGALIKASSMISVDAVPICARHGWCGCCASSSDHFPCQGAQPHSGDLLYWGTSTGGVVLLVLQGWRSCSLCGSKCTLVQWTQRKTYLTTNWISPQKLLLKVEDVGFSLVTSQKWFLRWDTFEEPEAAHHSKPFNPDNAEVKQKCTVSRDNHAISAKKE